MMITQFIDIQCHLDQKVMCLVLFRYLFCFIVCLALNQLISELDKRVTKKEVSKCGFRKKVQVVKSPSKLPCPSEAPKWAIAQPVEATTSDSRAVATKICVVRLKL